MASLIGTEIGKYRITERIGRGGMAEVYLGVHAHQDRKVAVKVLHSHLLERGHCYAGFGDKDASRQDYEHFMINSEGNPDFRIEREQVQAWLYNNP